MTDVKTISEGYCVELINETEMVEFGHRLAGHLTYGMIITLNGDLGAGKTTLSRGLLQALGHKGPVKARLTLLLNPMSYLLEKCIILIYIALMILRNLNISAFLIILKDQHSVLLNGQNAEANICKQLIWRLILNIF